MEEVVQQAPRYVFQAYHLVEALKLKSMEPRMGLPAATQTGTKLVYKDGEASFFFLYRFGAVVFFNIEPRRQTAILEKIKAIVGKSDIIMTSDEYGLEVHESAKNTVHFERVVIDRLTIDRIDLMALILAQSTTLEYFEIMVDKILAKSGEISSVLRSKGRLKYGSTRINRYIGNCMATKQDLATSLYLLDKPDETWEDQNLDALYREATEMFELKERYKTVDYKLRMIEEDLKLISTLLANRKAALLEWLIIALIAVEVVLFTYDLWTK